MNTFDKIHPLDYDIEPVFLWRIGDSCTIEGKTRAFPRAFTVLQHCDTLSSLFLVA